LQRLYPKKEIGTPRRFEKGLTDGGGHRKKIQNSIERKVLSGGKGEDRKACPGISEKKICRLRGDGFGVKRKEIGRGKRGKLKTSSGNVCARDSSGGSSAIALAALKKNFGH